MRNRVCDTTALVVTTPSQISVVTSGWSRAGKPGSGFTDTRVNMAAAPDVASLVSRAQQLSSTPQGLDALHTALEQSADLLKANAAEALAALEARALDPKRHALAWTHFLRAAVASTRPEKKLGERLRGDGPGASLPPGTLSAPAERGVAGDDDRHRRDADDDDADAATTEANEEGEHVLPETCTPETASAMDTPPGGGTRTPRAFGRENAFLGDATDDEGIAGRGDDDRAGDDAYYDDAVVDRIAEEASFGVDDTKHARSLAASFPAFRVLASELLRSSDDECESESVVSVAASAQVRRCFSAFAEVSRSFAHGALLAENTAVSALAAVAPLRAATRAARPTRDHLTKQHAFLFAACVACGRHDVVADDLDRFPVFETDPGVTGVDAMDYQKYCELGGTALVSLGRYADAAELFLRLACAPAARATPAHAAAHKKYVLCSLIADGACAFASSLPKYASPAVQRHVRGACAAYASLAEAYASGPAQKTRARFAESAETFERDGPETALLAETALRSLARRSTKKLTETHISLSLADIASIAELDEGEAEAERVVLEMIEAGEMTARIDAAARSVTFLDAADDPFAAEAEAAALAAAVDEARALAERVRRKDDALRASRAYVAATADLGVPGRPAGGKGKPDEGKRLPGDADGDGEDPFE